MSLFGFGMVWLGLLLGLLKRYFSRLGLKISVPPGLGFEVQGLGARGF